jgi:glycosyltransferase involved in cell wall biosynthesis
MSEETPVTSRIHLGSPARPIRVGLTPIHGVVSEICQFPPTGIEYLMLKALPKRPTWIRSSIKAYERMYDLQCCDLAESFMVPLFTNRPWILSCGNFQEASAFNIRGLPLPRTARIAWVRHLLAKDNCKRVLFWSEAGKNTAFDYGQIRDEALIRKIDVVYPAIRTVPDEMIRFNEGEVSLLFTGEFFRKGGVNVIDAFARAQARFPGIRLNLCCDETIDFSTPIPGLRQEYLSKIRSNPGISWLGRVSRDRLLTEILPETDVYMLPTYEEVFGFSILEAMAFGIPVISTNVFAIPELLENEVSGYLIDISSYHPERFVRGYVVVDLPEDFQEFLTENLYYRICQLVESSELRRRIGLAGLATARTKFSFETRNRAMSEIYRSSLRA